MTPIQLIKLHESEFTKSEIIIMNYILKHLDIISSYPISEVAEKCKVSKSALLRFCQKCGYQGYSEFKYEISRYLHSMVKVDQEDQDSTKLLLKLYSEQINRLDNKEITSAMDHLSDLILKARKIKIFGIHETGLSAQYFTYRLITLGIDSEVMTNPDVMCEKAGMATKEDLNIFISLSSETLSIKNSILGSLENKSQVFLITQNTHHKFTNKITGSMILPTFHNEKNLVFLDSQALIFITIDLIINTLARHMSTK